MALTEKAPQIQTEETDFVELDHKRSKRKHYENTGELLAEYVERTDALINGGMLAFERDEDGNNVPADVVIFLDKSARPLSWLTRKLWDTVAEKDEQGEVPPMPEMKFLNVDRLPWRKNKDHEITKDPTNMITPSEEDIEGLRSIFTIPGLRGLEDGLNGKRVLVVDEVSDSGDTSFVSCKLLSMAFPDAKIKPRSWMSEHRLGPQGEKIVTNVPVWYETDIESGRGVYGQVKSDSPDRNMSSHLTDGSHQFLSTRPKGVGIDANGQPEVRTVDQRGLQLRKEMAALALGVKNLDLPDGAVPALLNDHPNNEEYLQRVRAYKNRHR